MTKSGGEARDHFGTVQAMLDGLAARGDALALLALGQGGTAERWTYAELARDTARLAAGLLASGIRPGDAVAVAAAGRPEPILAALAAIRAGAFVVAIDEQLADRALAHVLEDSGAKVLFTGADEADRATALASGDLRIVLLDGAAEDARSWRTLMADTEVALPRVAPEDRAALFYTSGTTGTPKGVPLTHRNVAFEIEAVRAANIVTDKDRVLLPLPLHHVYPFVVGMLTPLALGLPLILPHALTGPEVVAAMREGRATLVIGVPRLYGALLDGIRMRLKARGPLVAGLLGGLLDLSTWLRRKTGIRIGILVAGPIRSQIGPDLRVLVSGGAALKEEIGWKIEGLGLCLATGYGLTETAPILTLGPPCRARPGSAGKPLAGVELRIDSKALGKDEDVVHRIASAPPGAAVGEVQARGPNVFRSYLNLPDETAAVFTEDGWFRTGDLGYFDRDGYLWLLGRASTLIVTAGGENVQPEDVEDAYAAHPAIAEIAVLAREGKLVALVVPKESAATGPRGAREAVRRALAEVSPRLPSYQRVSDFAIAREPIPRTRLGKPRRHLLAAAYDKARRSGGEPAAKPGPMPLEEMSAADRALLADPGARAVWDLLAARHPEARLTPDTSLLLDLGVDSIEWINLTLDIGERTGATLDEEAIAVIGTVRDLIRAVAGAHIKGQGLGGSVFDDPEAILKPEQRRWLAPLNPVQLFLGALLHKADRIWMRRSFDLTVEGRENLPRTPPFLIAPSHGSFLDPFALSAALDLDLLRKVQWAGWTGVAFRNAFFRFVMRLAQVVPVDPDRAVLSSIAFAAAILKRGRGLVWFPEGGRSPDGTLQPFKPGIGVLLDRFRVPVVPVLIFGAYDAWPPGQSLPKRHPVHIVILPPLDPAELVRTGVGATESERIANGLRARMQEAISARAPGRPSAPAEPEAIPPRTARG